jgi:Tfp pilus assembly protein PilX
MRLTRHQLPEAHRQHGAALFMALIFLLILTILGVFGMNLSRLENLMAGNAQFQTTALNNAEYVLARGEKDIEDIAKSGVVPFSAWNVDDQYYTVDTTPGGTPKDLVWPFTAAKVSIPDMNGDGSDTDADGTADDGTGQYVIENAGLDNSKGEDASFTGTINPLPGAIVQVFLVTAQSEASRGAKRIVQSVVVTDPLPPTP